MAQLKDTTITGSLAVSGTTNLTGATQHNGNVTLYSSSGDSPSLIFQRGTTSDTLNDYKIVDSGGYIKVYQEGNSGTSGFTQVAELTNAGKLSVSTPPATNTTPSTTAWISPTDSAVKVSDAAIRTGDKLLIGDASASNIIKSATGVTFDITNTTDYLRKDGTWATPSGGGGGGGGSGTVTGITAGTNLQVGDGTGSDTITTSGTLNHTASGVTAGTYVPYVSGKSTTVYFPSITVDAQGHITAASNTGYSMTAPSVTHATAAQNYNRNVGGVYYDEYGSIYYRTPYRITPVLNYGLGNDGVSPSSSSHGCPLGYSFFVLTAGQTSMTVIIYDSTYTLSLGYGWYKFIVTDVVARDATTKEPLIIGWSATEGDTETALYDDGFTKASTVTISIAEAYTHDIEFEILYHRIPIAAM